MHEPVVAMVPRLVAVLLVILATLGWMVSRWIQFTDELVRAIPALIA